jgi:hypothetical protein
MENLVDCSGVSGPSKFLHLRRFGGEDENRSRFVFIVAVLATYSEYFLQILDWHCLLHTSRTTVSYFDLHVGGFRSLQMQDPTLNKSLWPTHLEHCTYLIEDKERCFVSVLSNTASIREQVAARAVFAHSRRQGNALQEFFSSKS